MAGNALECSCLCSSTNVNIAGTCKRKFSLVCVVVFVLSLHLEQSTCQDKQTAESFSRNSSFPRELPSLISSQYYWLYTCCEHFLFSNASNPSDTEIYYNSTTQQTSSGQCNHANLVFQDKHENEDFDEDYRHTAYIASNTYTLQPQPPEGLCARVSQERVVININEIADNANTNILRKNGYLSIDREHYAPDEFCVDKINENHVEVLLCPMDCKNRLCIRKCCNPDDMVNMGVSGDAVSKMKKGCANPFSKSILASSSEPGGLFQPPIYHDFIDKVSKEELKNMRMPHFTETTLKGFKFQCFNNKTNVFPYSANVSEILSKALGNKFNHLEFKLRKDGQILYHHLNGRCTSQPDLFCIDRLQNYGENLDEISFSNLENPEDPTHDMMIVTCASISMTPGSVDHVSKIFGPLTLCASIFPFMTTIVYVLLWKKQTVHGWTIVSTSTSLLLMYIFIGTSHVIREIYGTAAHETSSCVFVAVAAHYFFLSTFSWLTVMCCDLWWTFRSLTPVNRRSKGIKRFIKYALFGWGMPLIFIISSLIIHNMEENCNDTMIVPGYGRESCYLTLRAQGTYIYYPSIILLSINLIFFTVTCIKLYQYRESCQMASKTDTRECKLFCVMGVTWIFEIVSWAIDGLGLYWYWAIFDVINILRAAAIFFIYVCKKDILNSLGESYPGLRKKIVRDRRSVNSQVVNKDGNTAVTLLAPNMSLTSANPSTNNSIEDITQL